VSQTDASGRPSDYICMTRRSLIFASVSLARVILFLRRICRAWSSPHCTSGWFDRDNLSNDSCGNSMDRSVSVLLTFFLWHGCVQVQVCFHHCLDRLSIFRLRNCGLFLSSSRSFSISSVLHYFPETMSESKSFLIVSSNIHKQCVCVYV